MAAGGGGGSLSSIHMYGPRTGSTDARSSLYVAGVTEAEHSRLADFGVVGHDYRSTGSSFGTSTRRRNSSVVQWQKAKKLESFDFNPYDSEVNLKEAEAKQKKDFRKIDIARWVMTFIIGVMTALVAVGITYFSRMASSYKYKAVNSAIASEQTGDYGPGTAFGTLLAFTLGYSALATIPVSWFNKVAAGSGISEIKCLLNGVKIPKAVRITTLVAKVFGVIFSVGSGLPVGKEGPMIHSGAILGAGLSQGKSTTLKIDTSWSKFKEFRNDVEKRDFVVCGSAAGVAAAFGAPVGGVLFALEEGASFWFQSLTWRAFFCAMISTYVLDIFLSGINPDTAWGKLSTPGMFSFGDFNDTGQNKQSYTIYEVPIFVLMGVVGGLMGAVFNGLNTRISRFRMRHLDTPLRKMLEAMLIATSFAAICFAASYAFRDCKAKPKGNASYYSNLVQFYCAEGEYDPAATLFITPSEDAILQLFHMKNPAPGDFVFSSGRLVVFFLIYAFYTCWTYGAAIPSGLFIPSLLSGSAFGRLVGDLLNLAFPHHVVDPGTYSLIGAAAFLGGMARMTISLAVILLESTGDYQYGLPLMLTLLFARWTGNIFNEGLYDIHIELRKWPLLEQDPTSVVHKLSVRDVMTKNPVVVEMFPRVEAVMNVLLQTQHNGFPVMYPPEMVDRHPELGTYAGIINRKHLCVLLYRSVFFPRQPKLPDLEELGGTGFASGLLGFGVKGKSLTGAVLSFTEAGRDPVLSYEDMEGHFPRFPPAHTIRLSPEDLRCYMDLRPYMNSVPFVVKEKAPAMQAFRLFRGLGMRHLVVVDDRHQVSGVITRQDLTHHALLHKWKKGLRGGGTHGRPASQRRRRLSGADSADVGMESP